MGFKEFTAGVVLLAIAATGVRADSVYIKSDAVDYKAILGPFPSPESEQQQKDLAEVLKLQESRTSKEIEQANREVALTPFTFSEVVGPTFNPDDRPFTAKFLKQVLVDYTAIGNDAKNYYKRSRPFIVDDRVHPCVPKEKGFSYPSGHSGRSMLLALIISEIYPAKKDALIDEAKRIGHDRVLGGAHFPTDVEAAQKLAKATFEKFMESDEFKADLEKARHECQVDKVPATQVDQSPENAN